MKHTLTVALGIACLALFLAGCGDDHGPAAPTSPQGQVKVPFALEVFPYSVGKDQTSNAFLVVDFAMAFTEQIPIVTINGVPIEDMWLTEHLVFRGEVFLPFAATVVWEIEVSNRTINGTVTMPTIGQPVRCNGVELNPSGTTTIDRAPNYTFRWTAVSSDYYYGGLDYWDPDQEDWWYWWFETEGTEISFEGLSGQDLDFFSVYPVRGVMLLPGAVPNATGSWAHGFVSYWGYGIGFDLDHPRDPLAPSQPRMANAAARAASRPEPPTATRTPLHERLAEYLR